MNIASSSSAVVAASSNPNDAKIEKLEAKRDRVEAERELVKNLLKVKEDKRPEFIQNNQAYEGLESFNTQELKEEKIRLDQTIHDFSAEILSLRTVSSGKYPHCYCHVSPYFNSYTCLFLIAWTYSFILSNHSFSCSTLLPFSFNMFSIRIYILCLLFISFYFPMISPCLCSSFLSTCTCSFIKYFSSLVIDYFYSWSWRC